MYKHEDVDYLVIFPLLNTTNHKAFKQIEYDSNMDVFWDDKYRELREQMKQMDKMYRLRMIKFLTQEMKEMDESRL